MFGLDKNDFLRIGGMLLLMIGVALGIYFLKIIFDIIQDIKNLTIKIEQLGNTRGNLTLDVLQTTERDILGNLTDHRVIQNTSRDQTHQEHEEIKNLIQNKTGNND